MKSSITVILLCLCVTAIAQPAIRHLTVEPNHSTIGFDVPIAGGITLVAGRFNDFDLKLTYLEGDWTASKVIFTIQAASIYTGIEARDEHLRSADFFDVEQYPEIRFVSNRIEAEEDNAYVAHGTFSMHGVERPMSIPFKVLSEDKNTLGIEIRTTIDRQEFGVGSEFKHTSIPNFLADEIPVRINFWTKKDKRE